jgi:hypothetical protein
MRGSKALVVGLGLVAASATVAAEDRPDPAAYQWPSKYLPTPNYYQALPGAPTWSIVGSFSPTFTDNALFSSTNRKSDFYYEPDVSLRLDGYLAPNLSYRLYARTLFEAFAREKDANEASLRIGGRLVKSMSDWRLTVSYEHRQEYIGIYRENLFPADDVATSVARDFTIGNVIFTPTALITYRFSDNVDVRRYRLDLLIPFEVPINERWSVVSTPFFEAFWFNDGINTGRRDQIYSASLGLRYKITDNVSLTTSVIYEQRESNVPLRHYKLFEVGPRLDFAF